MDVRPTLGHLIAVLAVALLAAGGASSQTPDRPPAERVALLAAVEGPIGPATERHVEAAIEAARDRGAEILILRLNTPGGLATSMRAIVAAILGSSVPVAGFVAPPGAHAASAGTYILYATHVAAMAPGTNLGAATPVQIGGGFPGQPQAPNGDKPTNGEEPRRDKDDGISPSSTMDAKATNDAVAFIRSLAEIHGRNADWAEKAVREAASLSANRAREERVIDLVADDVVGLLAALDGRTVTAGRAARTLATRNLVVERLEPGTLTKALAILANPNIAFLLLMIGVYGLIFELANPGSIGPGVLGAICLVLGLYALNQLPLNYAALALVVLGIALMVAEAFTPTFGVLGVGGAAALVIGAAMLIDADLPAFRISWWVIAGTAASSTAVLVFVLGYVWRVHRRPPTMGIVGAEAKVLDWAGGHGHVWAAGERWRARGSRDVAVGASVRIRALEGLILVVGDPPETANPSAPHAME